jgi:hypothetical protein
VRFAALRTQDLPRGRHFHALRRALLCFHFRRCFYPFFGSLPFRQSVKGLIQTENGCK